MKIYEILFEYLEYGDYGGWITDKNKILGADEQGDHLGILVDYGFYSYEDAFKAGWVRIIWGPDEWTLEGTAKNIKRIFPRISKRLFSQKDLSLSIDVLNNSLNGYKYNVFFILPNEKYKLIKFIQNL